MAGLEIDVDFSDIEEFYKHFPNFTHIANDEVMQAMIKSVAIAEEQVAARTPVNTGTLRASIHNMVIRKGDTVIGRVGTSKEYGAPVEYGWTPAGKWPPRDAIRLWVVRKLGLQGKEADSVAFLIQRAIGEGKSKGIMKPPPGGGAKMFELGFQAALGPVRVIWKQVPGKIIRRVKRP